MVSLVQLSHINTFNLIDYKYCGIQMCMSDFSGNKLNSFDFLLQLLLYLLILL